MQLMPSLSLSSAAADGHAQLLPVSAGRQTHSWLSPLLHRILHRRLLHPPPPLPPPSLPHPPLSSTTHKLSGAQSPSAPLHVLPIARHPDQSYGSRGVSVGIPRSRAFALRVWHSSRSDVQTREARIENKMEVDTCFFLIKTHCSHGVGTEDVNNVNKYRVTYSLNIKERRLRGSNDGF